MDSLHTKAFWCAPRSDDGRTRQAAVNPFTASDRGIRAAGNP